jgi:hypothetical protein
MIVQLQQEVSILTDRLQREAEAYFRQVKIACEQVDEYTVGVTISYDDCHAYYEFSVHDARNSNEYLQHAFGSMAMRLGRLVFTRREG